MTAAAKMATQPHSVADRVKAIVRSHVDAVAKADYDQLKVTLLEVLKDRDAARAEVGELAAQLQAEMQNAIRLTELAGRAVVSAEIYKRELIERQVGNGFESGVVVAHLPKSKSHHAGYVPLGKRRRMAKRKEEEEQVRRNALPTLEAKLPVVPLTEQDLEAMRPVVEELTNPKEPTKWEHDTDSPPVRHSTSAALR